MASKYRNIAGAATTTVKSGRGTLAGIIINKAVASGVITVYDNTAASGTKIATITNPAVLIDSQVCLIYEVDFDKGLTIVTSSTDDITITFY